MKCIAVERPQDLAKKGNGKIIASSNLSVKGVGTNFKKDLMVGDTIKFVASEVTLP